MRIVALGAIIIVLTGCSSGTDNSSDGVAVTSPTPTPTPTHNYVLNEGRDYGYEGGISEEDKKSGKVAPEVSMFRYLGEKDGTYKIQLLGNDGLPLMSASCSKPCEYMKLSTGERIKFDPSSLGGAVMQDALAGELEVYSAKAN